MSDKICPVCGGCEAERPSICEFCVQSYITAASHQRTCTRFDCDLEVVKFSWEKSAVTIHKQRIINKMQMVDLYAQGYRYSLEEAKEHKLQEVRRKIENLGKFIQNLKKMAGLKLVGFPKNLEVTRRRAIREDSLKLEELKSFLVSLESGC